VATEDDVRRIALSLPETIEKPWFGTPGFKVKDKGFLRIRSESDGGLVVWVADLGEKEMLLASEPDKFFTTPHYDGYPTVLVNLPAIDADELEELIIDSWRLRAPAKILKQYEDELTPAPAGEDEPTPAPAHEIEAKPKRKQAQQPQQAKRPSSPRQGRQRPHQEPDQQQAQQQQR
jgi:hypothetical protein